MNDRGDRARAGRGARVRDARGRIVDDREPIELSFHVGLACAAPPAPAPFVSRHAAEVGERRCGRDTEARRAGCRRPSRRPHRRRGLPRPRCHSGNEQRRYPPRGDGARARAPATHWCAARRVAHQASSSCASLVYLDRDIRPMRRHERPMLVLSEIGSALHWRAWDSRRCSTRTQCALPAWVTVVRLIAAAYPTVTWRALCS